MIYHPATQQYETIRQLRRAFPNTSFPEEPDGKTLASFNRVRVTPTEPPPGDVVTQGLPEQRDDGKWYQTWNTRDYTPEERTERLEQLRYEKISEINAAYTAAVEPLIREYPDPEPLSWVHQDTEAQAYLSWNAAGAEGDAPATPVLEQILAGRNGEDGTETMLGLCQAVERNAEQFRQAQVLTGKRQRLVKKVLLAESVEQVEAVQWI